MTTQRILKQHIACPVCPSTDAFCIYEDGHGFCYSCSYYQPSKNEGDFIIQQEVKTSVSSNGTFSSINDRNITLDTCKKYNVTINNKDNGNITHHLYPYYDKNNQHVASKIRTVKDKGFKIEGNFASTLLFGQQLFNQTGKYITIVEGELDALATYQMLGSQWPVVSIKSSTSAVKDCKQNLDYLSQFENVVICFDNDKQGKKAAENVARLFPPSTALIVPLEDYNDPCEYLINNEQPKFVKCWWNHKAYTPDGILCFSDMWKTLNTKDDAIAVPYPWEGLNTMTYGMRLGELCTYTAGSGQGKSSLLRELVYHLIQSTDYKVGMMFLEETPKRTALALCGLHLNKPIHLPDFEYTNEELDEAFKVFGLDRRLFLLDHFGSWGIDKILFNVRFLAKGMDCKFIFIDHISIIVSALESGDERRSIDEIMTKLRMLVQELNIHLGIVTHLKRVSGAGHEEGTSVSLSHLRGSAGIAQLSDMVIGMERNSQHDIERIRNTSTVRVLKNRFSGDTGPCTWLYYDRNKTGRLEEVEQPNDNDTNEENSDNNNNSFSPVVSAEEDTELDDVTVFDNPFIIR